MDGLFLHITTHNRANFLSYYKKCDWTHNTAMAMLCDKHLGTVESSMNL
jgi:hypothetical protein